jgi:hypothetical protein
MLRVFLLAQAVSEIICQQGVIRIHGFKFHSVNRCLVVFRQAGFSLLASSI